MATINLKGAGIEYHNLVKQAYEFGKGRASAEAARAICEDTKAELVARRAAALGVQQYRTINDSICEIDERLYRLNAEWTANNGGVISLLAGKTDSTKGLIQTAFDAGEKGEPLEILSHD